MQRRALSAVCTAGLVVTQIVRTQSFWLEIQSSQPKRTGQLPAVPAPLCRYREKVRNKDLKSDPGLLGKLLRILPCSLPAAPPIVEEGRGSPSLLCYQQVPEASCHPSGTNRWAEELRALPSWPQASKGDRGMAIIIIIICITYCGLNQGLCTGLHPQVFFFTQGLSNFPRLGSNLQPCFLSQRAGNI